ncbi:MAG: class I SAM-dependent methyltransferase [Sphingobacteriales bacterium JAD_PAG50586_3]|nr:MAG: class I SAM-dependent methyltransferase [Sphingobacteriales bacterium JAD_PAG50586_3]
MAENLETLTACPVCSGNTFTPFISCKDYTVSRGTFKIVSCGTCGFVATSPRPTEAEAYKYYQSEDYISHSNTRKGLINKVYAWVRNYSIKKKEQLVTTTLGLSPETRRGKRLLDHGCGTGEFLDYCQKHGWDTMGLEPGEEARKLAISNYGLKVIKEVEINLLEEKRFDAITLWHVLEHVYPLNERIQKLKQLLKDDGVLIVAVPNHNTAEEKNTENFGRPTMCQGIYGTLTKPA